MSDEVGRSLITKETALAELLQEMKLAGIEPADSNVNLPSVGESEKKVRSLERRMEAYGPVNMLAIEQFENCETRLNDMKDDFKILSSLQIRIPFSIFARTKACRHGAKPASSQP